MTPLHGHRALVTGASSGLGVALAQALAARGADLVLTARRAELLAEHAARLRRDRGVQVQTIALDLAPAAAPAALWAQATAVAPITILINNAGFGHYRAFTDVTAARDAELIALNVAAPVALAHAFAAATTPGRRYLLNVGSIVAWQAIPNFATYGASKAFLRSFSESLHHELAPRGVVVTCLCPGGTRTEFHAVAGAGDYGRLSRAAMLDADTVAEAGVNGLLRGRRVVVPGRLNRLALWATSMLPRGVASRAAARTMGPPRAEPLPDRANGATPPGPSCTSADPSAS